MENARKRSIDQEKRGLWACSKCGHEMALDDFRYWGECPACNNTSVFGMKQIHDDGRSGSQADRQYHGGQGHQGEW